jgi:acetoin utilization deacetylase AcuC-like enzyme
MTDPLGGSDPRISAGQIKVFYSPRQSAPGNNSYSPSAQKPALVVEAWQRTGLPIEIVAPRAATLTDLARAHDSTYVASVLLGRTRNGFGHIDPGITDTLVWTNGSMICAAEHAAIHRESTFSPTSGFHHAGWDSGHAFCTFNGLLIAALALRLRRRVRGVAILDLDAHFGDGTRDIIRRLGLEWVSHYTFGASPPTADAAVGWLAELPALVERTAAGADVVFFQAGVDPHIDDPLGGILTTAQLMERDRIVYETCRAIGVPVVTNLAGGYQRPVEKVIELHVNTMRAFAEVVGYRAEPMNPGSSESGLPLTASTVHPVPIR